MFEDKRLPEFEITVLNSVCLNVCVTPRGLKKPPPVTKVQWPKRALYTSTDNFEIETPGS